MHTTSLPTACVLMSKTKSRDHGGASITSPISKVEIDVPWNLGSLPPLGIPTPGHTQPHTYPPLPWTYPPLLVTPGGHPWTDRRL